MSDYPATQIVKATDSFQHRCAGGRMVGNPEVEVFEVNWPCPGIVGIDSEKR